MIRALLSVLGAETVAYAFVWILYLRRTKKSGAPPVGGEGKTKLAPQIGIGFFANFMDTLGVGSFAITSSIYKLLKVVADDLIPGTMNVGHAIPTVAEALIFIAVIAVDFRTLIAMIAASVLGAWVGAGMVSGWSKRRIQIGLGLALLAAAALLLGSLLNLYPIGGEAIGLTGLKFWAAVGGNFILGIFMQLGVGLYAPCMILVYFLGMTPRAAFPIMMGSCAFLMPVGSYQFIRARRYDSIAALGLTLGGVPAVLLAAYIVKSLPLNLVKWLVVFVVTYTAIMLLRSARQERLQAALAQKPAGD
ncbi:MAG TPA: sulfite exporter TauE/SafE family protein [Candidatus Acidoferrales bacterium]|nr:sulfite exporter TauE/SafE family protein [Candidatus Acidoferrales bacterium]